MSGGSSFLETENIAPFSRSILRWNLAQWGKDGFHPTLKADVVAAPLNLKNLEPTTRFLEGFAQLDMMWQWDKNRMGFSFGGGTHPLAFDTCPSNIDPTLRNNRIHMPNGVLSIGYTRQLGDGKSDKVDRVDVKGRCRRLAIEITKILKRYELQIILNFRKIVAKYMGTYLERILSEDKAVIYSELCKDPMTRQAIRDLKDMTAFIKNLHGLLQLVGFHSKFKGNGIINVTDIHIAGVEPLLKALSGDDGGLESFTEFVDLFKGKKFGLINPPINEIQKNLGIPNDLGKDAKTLEPLGSYLDIDKFHSEQSAKPVFERVLKNTAGKSFIQSEKVKEIIKRPPSVDMLIKDVAGVKLKQLDGYIRVVGGNLGNRGFKELNVKLDGLIDAVVNTIYLNEAIKTLEQIKLGSQREQIGLYASVYSTPSILTESTINLFPTRDKFKLGIFSLFNVPDYMGNNLLLNAEISASGPIYGPSSSVLGQEVREITGDDWYESWYKYSAIYMLLGLANQYRFGNHKLVPSIRFRALLHEKFSAAGAPLWLGGTLAYRLFIPKLGIPHTFSIEGAAATSLLDKAGLGNEFRGSLSMSAWFQWWNKLTLTGAFSFVGIQPWGDSYSEIREECGYTDEDDNLCRIILVWPHYRPGGWGLDGRFSLRYRLLQGKYGYFDLGGVMGANYLSHNGGLGVFVGIGASGRVGK